MIMNYYVGQYEVHRALRSVVGREGARNASESADQEARKELTDA